jgi:hypothetical protein
LFGKLRAHPYSERSGAGFRILRSTKQEASGEFIERFDYETVVEDPFGKVQRFTRVEYQTVSFHISGDAPGLELVDPPRSTKAFVGSVGAATDHQIAIEPVYPPVAPWLQAIEHRVGKLRVKSMEMSGLVLSATTSAAVVVTSGSDARKDARSLISQWKGQMVAAEIEWRDGDDLVACSLSNRGFTYEDRDEPRVVGKVRDALRQVLIEL